MSVYLGVLEGVRAIRVRVGPLADRRRRLVRPQRLLILSGFVVAALFVAGSVAAQEMQEVTTPDGRTIKLPAGAPAHIVERIRSGKMPGTSGRPPSSGSAPGQSEKEGEKKEEDEKDQDQKDEDEKKEDGEKKDEESEEKKPEPVTRDSVPPPEADPKELEVRPDEEGMVRFNFVGQKWLDVLQWLAEISDMSLDWQELPGDYLNLTTQRAYTVPETRDLINRHLLARGYTLLSEGEVLSVAKIDELDPSRVPRVEPEQLADRDSNEYVKVSFPLEWLLAEDAVEELKPMMSPNGKLVPLTATNRLEAMDAVANLQDIYRVLKEEQSGSGQERLVREFLLENSLAEQVVKQLHDLLGLEKKSGGPAKPMTPDQVRAMQEAAKRAAAAAKKGGAPPKSKPEVYLVANKRKNSILANAPPDVMAKIEQAIEALDVPTEKAHSLLRNMDRMQVYRLESVDPDALIDTLEELGDLDFDTRLEADDENNAIVAYASLADHLTIRALVEKLDGGGRRAEVIPLEVLRAESVAEVVDFVMGGGKAEEDDGRSRSRRSYYLWDRYRGSSSRGRDDDHEDRFRVDADTKNNSLVLWCNELELRKVENLLERLRENQRDDDGASKVEVYRLATLDPEPFVATLEEMETLSFQARLEVDEANNSIVLYGTEADHAEVKELIEQLDGSGRGFHLFELRSLEADYVAGTIAWMMAGKEEQQSSGYSRTYVYNEYFGGGPSSRDRDKKPDEFRVDADVEYNRLLLWANEVEMEEVKNLLVKLGEIPAEGEDASTIRVLDVLPGPEKERLLERIRRIWPSLAPNPLVTPEESEEEGKESEGEEKAGEPERPAAESRPAAAVTGADASVFRFVQLEQEGEPAAASEGAATQPAAEGTAKPTVPEKAEKPQPEENADSPSPPTADESDDPDSASPSEEDKTPKESEGADEESGAPEQPAEAAPAKEPPKEPSSAPAQDANKGAPVSITEAPDGRLIIASEDTEALSRLEELISRLAPPRKDYHVFKLQYAEAYWVKWNLEDFFEEEDESDSSRGRYDYYFGYPRSSGSSDTTPRLSRRRPLRFISDDDTNTILVQGASADQLRTIEDLIELYDQPPATDSESARRTEVFQVHYSKADVVAEAVKDVYRDLLSDRDKSLAGRPDQQQRNESRYSYTYVLGDEGDERRMPRWKGYLSIGVDTLSNALIVSAPEFLFRDIEGLITGLDEAARPTDAVQVMQLGQGVSATVVQETLSKVLAEAAAERTGASAGNGRRDNGRRDNGRRPFGDRRGRPGD